MKGLSVNRWKFLITSVCCSLTVLTGCKREEKHGEVQQPKEDTIAGKVKKFFASLPSPFEVSRTLADAGVTFNKSILAPIEETGKFHTRGEKARIIGVFAADMSYSILFGSIQEALSYFNQIHKLFQELNIGEIISRDIADKIKMYENNADSLQLLMNQSFSILNTVISQNKQEDIGIYILGSANIEGLYILLKSLNTKEPQENLLELIVSNRDVIEIIVSMIKSSSIQLDREYINQIEKIHAALSKFKVEEKTYAEAKGANIKLGGETKVSWTEQDLQELISTVENARNYLLKKA